MTCQEVAMRLNEIEREGSLPATERESVAAHLSACVKCHALVEERRELANSLKLVRASAPFASEQLDVRVLADYRQFISDRRNAPRRMFARPWILAWSGVAMAGVLLAVGFLAMRPHKTVATPASRTVQQTVAESPATPETVHAGTIRATQSAKVPHTSKPRHRVARAEQSRAAAEVVHSLPDDFRRLMYCDELSCAQDMDMIHIQLPTAFALRSGRFVPQSGGLVNADVLVGPDGIARGIRFEQ